MTRREKIAARIRALKAKTVANGCTEGEAVAAAEKVAQLLADNDMTLDEAELRETPFARSRDVQDDWVGERLWKIADGIEHLVGVRYWASRPGEPHAIHFFGFEHEVEIARYLLAICSRAMRTEQDRRTAGLYTRSKQRKAALPYLDGMADRLRQRLRAMKPAAPAGAGLVPVRDQLIDAALGAQIREGRATRSRDFDPSYAEGLAAGDRVALSSALRGPSSSQGALTHG